MLSHSRFLSAALLGLLPFCASAAEETAAIDTGDTAWMIVATALVLFMTLPGLALFYGGLVRSKNVLSVLVQCFAIAGVMSLLWMVIGYSLAFTGDGEHNNGIIGGFSKAFMWGVTPDSVSGSIPEILFAAFQMTFFIITPALICGGFAERMKFSSMLVFSMLWGLLSYLPICHMAWTEGGLFESWGVLDFAGGTVVHINAGIAALIAALLLGKRLGYPERPMKPHNLTMCLTGTGMLWVGWFGFNAGSELAANGAAAMALFVTSLSAATAAVTWMLIEIVKHGKTSALGIASGAVAGLVGITPAAGSAGPMGALIIGVACGLGCYWGAVWLKQKAGWDDSLDAFGVHGVGGIIGALLTGVCAHEAFGGFKILFSDEVSVVSQIGTQVWWQLASVLVTLVWSAVISLVLLKVLDATLGLRVARDDEDRGLDLSLHEEQGYIM